MPGRETPLSLLQSALLQSLVGGAVLTYGLAPRYLWMLESDGRQSYPHARTVRGLVQRDLIRMVPGTVRFEITAEGRSALAAGHTTNPAQVRRQSPRQAFNLSQVTSGKTGTP